MRLSPIRAFVRSVFTLVLATSPVFCQSLGNAGTIEGTVIDPSGSVIPKAHIVLRNSVSGYQQATISADDGTFRLGNIPPNPYHLEVTASGFALFTQDLAIRSAVPVQLKATLALAGAKSAVTVEAAGADILEVDPSAHTDTDRTLITKLPTFDPGGGLTQAITYASGGVVADANGLFHPVGDHSQTSFMIDGQPISDQQSKVFSTQLPPSAIESMEVVTGTPGAEFGDKSSLIANITTRSGLHAGRVFGNLDGTYGSFGSSGGSAGLGFGNDKMGNFLAVDGVRSGRFLDTPELTAFHDKGNSQTIFDRFDYQPDQNDIFHLNLFVARNWIQIPNTYDTLDQDQHQRVMTWNFAPGFQRTITPHVLLTVSPYIRKDNFHYYGSRDPFSDSPSTQFQARALLNWGVKSDLAIASGRHDLKIGIDLKQTRLQENFGFGITDPAFNAGCFDSSGSCSPGLSPFDLTRGGSLFGFH